MAYTFTQKTNAETGTSLFGGLVNDANHIAMSGAAGIQTQDATATPVTSPIAVSNSSASTLNVPANATYFNIIALANTVNVCEVSSSVTTYFTAPTGVLLRIPCARMSQIFLKANTGAATGTTFWFECV